MLTLPTHLQTLLREHHIDPSDTDGLRMSIHHFTDPLTPEQFVTLVQLRAVLQILLPDDQRGSSELLYFQYAVLRMAEFFLACHNHDLAKLLIEKSRSSIHRINNSWEFHLGLQWLITLLVQIGDYEAAKQLIENDKALRFMYVAACANAYLKSGELDKAREVLIEADQLATTADLSVDELEMWSENLIALGMVDRVREYLSRCRQLIQKGEQVDGDEYSHQKWARLGLAYAQIGDLEAAWEAADLSPREHGRALRFVVRGLCEIGRFSDAEKTIERIKVDPDDNYQLGRAMVYLAQGYYDKGRLQDAEGAFDQAEKLFEQDFYIREKLRLSFRLLPVLHHVSDTQRLARIIKRADDYLELFIEEVETNLDGFYLFINEECFRYIRSLSEIGDFSKAHEVLIGFSRPNQIYYGSSCLLVADVYGRAKHYAAAIKWLPDNSLNQWFQLTLKWVTGAEPPMIHAFEKAMRETVSVLALVDPDWRDVERIFAG